MTVSPTLHFYKITFPQQVIPPCLLALRTSTNMPPKQRIPAKLSQSLSRSSEGGVCNCRMSVSQAAFCRHASGYDKKWCQNTSLVPKLRHTKHWGTLNFQTQKNTPTNWATLNFQTQKNTPTNWVTLTFRHRRTRQRTGSLLTLRHRRTRQRTGSLLTFRHRRTRQRTEPLLNFWHRRTRQRTGPLFSFHKQKNMPTDLATLKFQTQKNTPTNWATLNFQTQKNTHRHIIDNKRFVFLRLSRVLVEPH
jgi:hypothetical protein